MPRTLILRALLALVFLLLLLAGGVYEVATSILSGEARVPFRRWSHPLWVALGLAVLIGVHALAST
jgi:hypothetical protein